MSKKKKKIIVGMFYHFYNGPAHPAMVYENVKKYGTYRAIKTGTTKRKDMIKIKPIQSGKETFVHLRPVEGTRRDFGERELKDLSFNADDQEIIDEIKKRKPKLTKSAKKKRQIKMPSND